MGLDRNEYHFDGPPESFIGEKEANNARLSRLISSESEWKRKFGAKDAITLGNNDSVVLSDGGVVLGTAFSYYLSIAEIIANPDGRMPTIRWGLDKRSKTYELTPETRTFSDFFEISATDLGEAELTGLSDIPLIVIPGGRLTEVTNWERVKIWFGKMCV